MSPKNIVALGKLNGRKAKQHEEINKKNKIELLFITPSLL